MIWCVLSSNNGVILISSTASPKSRTMTTNLITNTRCDLYMWHCQLGPSTWWDKHPLKHIHIQWRESNPVFLFLSPLGIILCSEVDVGTNINTACVGLEGRDHLQDLSLPGFIHITQRRRWIHCSSDGDSGLIDLSLHNGDFPNFTSSNLVGGMYGCYNPFIMNNHIRLPKRGGAMAVCIVDDG